MDNQPSTIEPITGLIEPVKVGTAITNSAAFIDPNITDTHSAIWNWNDGTTSEGVINEENGNGTVIGTHVYTSAGVYKITLTLTDSNGAEATDTSDYVVVYDPEGGFVTGGGWIDSPAGAYKADESLIGKATFGFVSKYKKGRNVPTGQTEFQFHVADLNFHSNSYEWLVVTGSDYAKFKGTGTINGVGEYKFMIWAGDGEPDTFRIRIWEEDEFGIETDIYDNAFNQAIGGGSIVIHTK
jgi:PKD repeat protein